MSSPQLCTSCRHRFPASGLANAAFTDEVGKRFSAVHALVDRMNGIARSLASGGGRRAAADVEDLRQEMDVALLDLCASVQEETAALRRQVALAEDQRASRDKDLEAANARIATLTVGQEDATSGNSMRGSKLGAPAAAASGAVRAPPQPTFNGAVAGYQQKKMTTAFDLVSASIYSMLESVAIETRADTALLWIRPRGVVTIELVAPFVVGRDISALRSSAPYRVLETSMAAAVTSTGAAVNVKPMVGVRDTRTAQEINIHELLETSNVAQLLVPVYGRYSSGTTMSAGGTDVLGVLHLIGSPRCPFPFNRRNEDAAMHAALFLSSIMSSHYQVMAGEWGNHFYHPDIIQSTSTFQGQLDLRADEKVVDDFTPSPMLVYRCTKDPSGPTDPRESAAALRTAMSRAAVPMQPVLTRVRDLHRHATAMEANWTSAVDATTQLEHRMGIINEETVRNDVQRLREAREAAVAAASYSFGSREGKGTMRPLHASGADAAESAVTPALATKATTALSESLTSLDGNVPLTAAVPMTQGDKGGKSDPALKPEEVDRLEAVALKRLANLGVDATSFFLSSP